MKQCQDCKESFPNHLVREMVKGMTGRRAATTELCPFCALKEMRAVSGDPNYMFVGTHAREIYEAALEYRKENGR